jgi:ATP phosphoribosyltransferase regulatory subunit
LGLGLEDRYGRASRVFAPWSSDPDLQSAVERIRGTGRQVVMELPGQECGAGDLGCSERLVREEAGWVLIPV